MEQNKLATNNPSGYNERRNFVQLFPQFIREKDFFSYCQAIAYKLTGKGYYPFFQGLFYRPILKKNKLYHFFNAINLNKVDWVVTFETTLPRLGKGHRWFHARAMKQMARKNCKKIIALSQCSYDLQVVNLKENYPDYLELILPKMIVLHPSQKPLISNYQEKQVSAGKTVFTIVGVDFFRKGGREVLNVFDKLIPENPNVYLKIISSMQYGDYASQTTESDLDRTKEIIRKYPDNIKLYSSLPNDEVLKILKHTHVSLLPTWGDSYGYSVLESQAAGCPVISTDLRALPEINNNQVGWLIKVPKLVNNNANIGTKEKRKIYQQIIEKQLEKIIREILNNPCVIKEKGVKSLENIKTNHNIDVVKAKLKNIYSSI